MIKLNYQYEVNIEKSDYYGSGITHIDGMIVFVPNALPNEKILIKIIRLEKTYALGTIINIITKSPQRIHPLCPKYLECGGCSFGHATFVEENSIKNAYLQELFKDIEVNNIIANEPYNTRNKVTLHVHHNQLGLYKENTNCLVPIDYCYLLKEEINKTIKILKKIDLSKVEEITIKYSSYLHEIMLIIKGFIKDYSVLMNQKEITTIYQNQNLIYGKPHIQEKIDNLEFQISKESFFQTNIPITEILYKTIKEKIGTGKKLLDLYCGTGTIGLFLQDNYQEILGIEINKDAIRDAQNNAKINNITNVTFKCIDASKITINHYDAIVIDPPRSGLNKKTITNLLAINTPKIIYVSCNPNTLKRDLNNLNNYNVQEIIPFNMFPRTKHVECVCVLNRR